MKAPSFWHQKNFIIAALLSPLGYLYSVITRWIGKRKSPIKLASPVICVGNLVMGGAGKTPVALMLAEILQQQRKNVHFLTRGYGGNLKGPVQVNQHHTHQDVGDEPLILAKVAPTWISRDRALGGQAAVQAGAEIIILDDGHQNMSLAKDISLLVIDSDYGHGNGYVFPAGPLRESVAQGFERADGIILVGEKPFSMSPSLPFIRVSFLPLQEDLKKLTDQSIIVFAGIGRPNKFFQMLESHQIEYNFKILEKIAYADHHVYTLKEMAALQAKAQHQNAILVTTEKDLMRCQNLEKIHKVRIVSHLIEGNWNDFWHTVNMKLENKI
ncbi:MAG: tetraacyldisaccharide 4'-kinase [Janthinobacterium lividum]